MGPARSGDQGRNRSRRRWSASCRLSRCLLAKGRSKGGGGVVSPKREKTTGKRSGGDRPVRNDMTSETPPVARPSASLMTATYWVLLWEHDVSESAPSATTSRRCRRARAERRQQRTHGVVGRPNVFARAGRAVPSRVVEGDVGRIVKRRLGKGDEGVGQSQETASRSVR